MLRLRLDAWETRPNEFVLLLDCKRTELFYMPIFVEVIANP